MELQGLLQSSVLEVDEPLPLDQVDGQSSELRSVQQLLLHLQSSGVDLSSELPPQSCILLVLLFSPVPSHHVFTSLLVELCDHWQQRLNQHSASSESSVEHPLVGDDAEDGCAGEAVLVLLEGLADELVSHLQDLLQHVVKLC